MSTKAKKCKLIDQGQAVVYLRSYEAWVGNVDGAVRSCIRSLSLVAVRGGQVLTRHGGPGRLWQSIQPWVSPTSTATITCAWTVKLPQQELQSIFLQCKQGTCCPSFDTHKQKIRSSSIVMCGHGTCILFRKTLLNMKTQPWVQQSPGMNST